MLYQSSFLLLFCFRNVPVYCFIVFSVPTFLKRQFATSQQQEKCRTTQHFLYKPVLVHTCTRKNSRAGLWHRTVLWEQCLHQLSSQPGWCCRAGEVVLTHPSHIKLCWLPWPGSLLAPHLTSELVRIVYLIMHLIVLSVSFRAADTDMPATFVQLPHSVFMFEFPWTRWTAMCRKILPINF